MEEIESSIDRYLTALDSPDKQVSLTDPGHDKGRLANHDAVKSSFVRSLSAASDRLRWLFCSLPGTPPGFAFPLTASTFNLANRALAP
jgi:hypothetical protein